MAKITGGALVAQVLRNDGIEHLFGIVGGHVGVSRRVSA